jgi:hypothetical protein
VLGGFYKGILQSIFGQIKIAAPINQRSQQLAILLAVYAL